MTREKLLCISAQLFLSLPKERRDLIQNKLKEVRKDLLKFASDNELAPFEMVILVDALNNNILSFIEEKGSEFIRNIQN